MAGVVTSVLTDKELDSLIGAIEDAAAFVLLGESTWQLHAKLVAWRRSLDCTAGKCAQLRGRDDV